jgi:predicted DNA-binding transcriptional regulator YafY
MRAQRLLSILLHLQVNRRMTARDLARKLEVSERTILRDMDALSSAGVPVVAERGAGGGWSLIEEYQTKLTGLTPAEIQSLFLARTPDLMADLGLKQAQDGAWIKLEASLPAGVRQHARFVQQRVLIDARGWRDPSESASSLPLLLDGLWRDKKVRFLYESVLCEATQRTVDPLGLVARGSIWYLIAVRDGELRTYRVSRIKELEVLDLPARRPAGFDLAEYWKRSAAEFREKLPQYRATFLAKPAVMRWVRYRGWRLESEERQGALMRIQLRFDAEEEALQFALSLGSDVEVLQPTPLRDRTQQAALNILLMYGKSDVRLPESQLSDAGLSAG